MSVQVEKLEKNMAKLTVEVPAENVEKAIQGAYNKMKKSINIPGFRKGKAPRQLIEKMYGKEVFYNDAIDAMLPSAYSDLYSFVYLYHWIYRIPAIPYFSDCTGLSLVLSGIVLWICSGLAGTGTPQPPVLNESASMPDQSGNRTDRLYHCPMLWTDLCLFDSPCHERFFHPYQLVQGILRPLSADLLRRCTFPPPAGYTGTVLRRCILRNRFSVGSAASRL